MNFKAYDIFSSLIPGFLMLIALLEFVGISFDKDLVVPYTAIAFLAGYLVNAIGSWLERVYFWTWGGKPSSRLLKGKGLGKIKVYNYAALAANLTTKASSATPGTDELFAIAFRSVKQEKDTRIEDFNAIYAFSRTLLTVSLIGGPMILSRHGSEWKYYMIVIPVIMMLWIRCRQRGYYFSKEVLDVYSNKNSL